MLSILLRLKILLKGEKLLVLQYDVLSTISNKMTNGINIIINGLNHLNIVNKNSYSISEEMTIQDTRNQNREFAKSVCIPIFR